MTRSNSASAPVLTIGYCTDDRTVFRLCASKKLTWDEKAKILGMPKSTLQRHYR